jgi:hypothetical protein
MNNAYLIGMYKNNRLISIQIFSEPAESITQRFTPGITYKTIDQESGASYADAQEILQKRTERLFSRGQAK